MSNTIMVYYTIYYGFRRYRYDFPRIGRRLLAKKIHIPYQNIEIGVCNFFPMWDNRRGNAVMWRIGKIMCKLRAKP